MTVRINKPALNLREKLAELDKPSGIVGEQILRSDTAEDAREALNLEEHLFEDFESTGIQDNATSTKVTVSDSGVDVTGTVTADGLTVSNAASIATSIESTTTTAGFDLKDSVSFTRFTNSNGTFKIDSNDDGAGGTSDIVLAQSGVERLRIEDNGNVEFFEDTGTTAKMVWSSSTESLNVGSSQLNFSTTKVQTGSATSPAAGFNVFTSSTGDGYLLFSDGNTGNQAYTGQIRYNHGSDFMAFGTNGGSERMRLDSSGNLLVGTTTNTNSYRSVVNGLSNSNGLYIGAYTDNEMLVLHSRYAQSSGGVRFKLGTVGGEVEVGSITFNSLGTNYNTSSDERLKENIQDTTHTVDIDDLQVREFDWKANGSHQRYGFIAQELETVYPEAVSTDASEEQMKSVDYSKLVPLLVKEIQTLKSRIETLENN